MITIIAEKPSVALEIAHIVGAHKREDGFMSGNGYAVTWAFGHLVEIFSEGGDDWGTPLPFLPEEFRLRVIQTRGKDGKPHVDSGCLKQLKIISRLFAKSEYIINAGDAGREGELIQRYIYRYVDGSAPVRRLWVSSLSDEAIREGLDNIRPSEEYDNLYLAGKARNEADWMVGVNATRALTRIMGNERVFSLGRVQTPTLALVCRRYLENKNFVPESFWRILAQSSLGTEPFLVRSDTKYSSKEQCCSDIEAVLNDGILKVDTVERKEINRQPPLLYDLTALQRDANKRYSMTAQQTLSAAQALYEKKLITYPRTGSRYIPKDIFHKIPSILCKLAVQNPKGPAAGLSSQRLNMHSVNDEKVTDHHALIPTGIAPSGLTEDGRRVYELITTRLYEALSPVCSMIETKVHLCSAGVGFTLSSTMTIEPGWKSIRGEKEEQKDEDGNVIPQRIPSFLEGDVCKVSSCTCEEGKTKPKQIFTEDTLLEAMKYAGREVVDEDLKEAIKDCGLGTPATRAAEIETIVRRGYVARKGKQLIPTETGLAVYEVVKDKSIADVEMTASWEKALSEIADGTASAQQFDRGIRDYTKRIVEELLASATSVGPAITGRTMEGASCPICGRELILTTRLARCTDENCGWKIWRTILGKNLSEEDISALAHGESTKEIKAFRSKGGKYFNAQLRLRENGEIEFVFKKREQKQKREQ
ncbi:MAG: DNA topoisomerase [Bacteroidales bacterium]|nr:DNA topoisomerase [Bacteroidales bacterium]